MIEYWIDVGARNWPIARPRCATPSTREGEVGGELAREGQDADGEDDRDDAGEVDPQGRNVWPPWYMRRPRTRLAYWIGIRRWPSWM
jgi:hypothetical protein